jgi:DNA-binding MarR family transcriptional regulator
MGSGQIEDDVRRLLREHVENYEQLDALLLLRNHPDGSWTAGAVAERLKIPPSSASKALEDLRRNGLVDIGGERGDPVARFAPVTSSLARAVEQLSVAYEDHRLEVMNLMNENAIERVRFAAIRTFAEAFVVRKGKKDA